MVGGLAASGIDDQQSLGVPQGCPGIFGFMHDV